MYTNIYLKLKQMNKFQLQEIKHKMNIKTDNNTKQKIIENILKPLNKKYNYEGKRIVLNLIGPVYVFQTNVDGRNILFLGDRHESLEYNKNSKKFLPKDKLFELYKKYKDENKQLSAVKYVNFVKKLLDEYKEYYHNNPIQQNKDILLHDYIYYLATNKHICFDLFIEEKFYYQNELADYYIDHSYLSTLSFLFRLCGKGNNNSNMVNYCLKTFPSLRYHQTDLRKFSLNLREFTQKKNYRGIGFVEDYVVKDYKTEQEACFLIVDIYITVLFSGDIDKLESIFKKYFITSRLAKAYNKSHIVLLIEDFGLIQKQFLKSEFSIKENFIKFKKIYLNIIKTYRQKYMTTLETELDCNKIDFHFMNIYNLCRMFVKKNIWSNKKRKNLSKNCKKSEYPKNIITYQGADHCRYYGEFVKQYYNLKKGQFHSINQRKEYTNDRYVQIICKDVDGVILPAF